MSRGPWMVDVLRGSCRGGCAPAERTGWPFWLDVVFNAVPLLAFVVAVACEGVQVCARDAVSLHAVGTALACPGCISVFVCWGILWEGHRVTTPA